MIILFIEMIKVIEIIIYNDTINNNNNNTNTNNDNDIITIKHTYI